MAGFLYWQAACCLLQCSWQNLRCGSYFSWVVVFQTHFWDGCSGCKWVALPGSVRWGASSCLTLPPAVYPAADLGGRAGGGVLRLPLQAHLACSCLSGCSPASGAFPQSSRATTEGLEVWVSLLPSPDGQGTGVGARGLLTVQIGPMSSGGLGSYSDSMWSGVPSLNDIFCVWYHISI